MPLSPTPRPSPLPDPQPLAFPRDDGPHDRLTEWWYYTGHLASPEGRRFGFEAVIFRAERGDVPVTWASHLALTDESGHRFLYGQRSEVGPAVDSSPRDASGAPMGFDLAIGAETAAPWRLSGSDGRDHVQANLPAAEATGGSGFGLDLGLTAVKPPALHMAIGWVPFGPAGGSYYYSRTRLTVGGTLTLDGTTMAVSGEAWFDHQWGDFIAVGGGGWDWYAVNLGDGTDVTLSLVRAADGTYPLVYGTLVDSRAASRSLDATQFTIATAGTWTSPSTGATYAAGWRITVPVAQLTVDLFPTLADQELDTRKTTGVIYWEGSQVVRATRLGAPVGGEAYVELTGYSAATPSLP